MTVAEAAVRRFSARAFKPDPVPGGVVREILEIAHRAPSGGNLQPWRVYALAGEPLAQFKAIMRDRVVAAPRGEGAEYDVYPRELDDKYKARRFTVGEDLYASLGVPREDKAGRLRQFARNSSSSGLLSGCSSASTAAWGRRSGRIWGCTCRR
jgi:nitroreductase